MSASSGPKERLLQTASRLFYEQGYNLTGINQILEESGVAKASLYAHYGSKDDLAIAYLRDSSDRWLRSLKDVVDQQPDPTRRVFACFEFIEAGIRKRKFRGCRFINMMAEINDASEEIHAEIVKHKSKLRKLIKTLTAEASAEDDGLGDTVYLLFEGAIIESRVFKNLWPVKNAKQTVETLLKTRLSTHHKTN
jgi:AcrR family transcriptional regulator